MKSFLAVLVAIALAAIVNGAWQILSPSYSDAQIAASLVDTWQPHAFVTGVVLALLFTAGCVVLACLFAGRHLRRISCVALLAIFVAIGTQFAGHVLLSHQATRVTGQTFGALYGLL